MKKSEQQALIAIPVILLVGLAISWAGSQNGAVTSGWPVFALCGAVAFLINWVVFVHAYTAQTEHFFDLTGSLTYLSLVALGFALSGEADARSLLVAGLVILWAGRLGSFLFFRVRRDGGDGRFDRIKVSFVRFLMAWTLQGLWVLLTLACALAAITTASAKPLGAFAFVGLGIWVVGFAIEVIADRQKSEFRSRPENQGRFIESGLWAWSRHPNYFGEITLWVGIAVMAFPVLGGWQYATLISPVFVAVLLTRISGIPLLDARAKKAWGDEPTYQAYRSRTPALIPRPPRSA